MSLPPFHPGDSSTWSATLTLQEVALIYQQTPGAIRRSLQPSAKTVARVPPPDSRHPLTWRKVDIVRDREGSRMPQRRAS